jgi:hypothetical protein
MVWDRQSQMATENPASQGQRNSCCAFISRRSLMRRSSASQAVRYNPTGNSHTPVYILGEAQALPINRRADNLAIRRRTRSVGSLSFANTMRAATYPKGDNLQRHVHPKTSSSLQRPVFIVFSASCRKLQAASPRSPSRRIYGSAGAVPIADGVAVWIGTKSAGGCAMSSDKVDGAARLKTDSFSGAAALGFSRR